MNMPIRVILVEDDAMLRESLTHYLEFAGYAVTTPNNGLSYYRALGESEFAVAVIALNLPDQGMETMIEYTRQHTTSAIIVISARDTLETRIHCYRTGADLFLGKPVHGRELAAAIGSLAARRAWARSDQPMGNTATAPASSGIWRLLARQRLLQLPDGGQLALTPREYQLLDMLAAGNGAPVLRGVLLDALYARQDDSAQRALESLVRRTRRKIADRYFGPSPILTEHGRGYVLAAPVRRA